MKKYIIDEQRLKELLKAELKLMALEGGGVDNWSWYCDSLNDFFKEDFKSNLPCYRIFFNLDEEKRPDEFEDFEMDFNFDDIVEFDISCYTLMEAENDE